MKIRNFLKYVSQSTYIEVYHNNKRVFSGFAEKMDDELLDSWIKEDSAFPNTYGEMEIFIK